MEDNEIFGTDIRKLFKVGNSLAITIPKKYIEEHDLKRGDPVFVFYNDVFHVEPIRKDMVLKKLVLEKQGMSAGTLSKVAKLVRVGDSGLDK